MFLHILVNLTLMFFFQKCFIFAWALNGVVPGSNPSARNQIEIMVVQYGLAFLGSALPC